MNKVTEHALRDDVVVRPNTGLFLAAARAVVTSLRFKELHGCMKPCTTN